jgi:hypothetical protein
MLAATPAAAEHPPVELSARALLKGYWSFPSDWDRRGVGHPLEVTGFVQRVVEVAPHRVALDFDVGELSYAVRCEMARGEAKKARALSPGQLVVARGVGAPAVRDQPGLKDCAITWHLEPTAPGQEEVRAAVSAASLMLCTTEKPVPESARDTGSKYFPDAETVRQSLRARAVAAIQFAHATALSCQDPLLSIVWRCLSGTHAWNGWKEPIADRWPRNVRTDATFPAECNAPEVRTAVDASRQMQRSLADGVNRPDGSTAK